MEMTDQNRVDRDTDLPHDQAKNDNDGAMNDRPNIGDVTDDNIELNVDDELTTTSIKENRGRRDEETAAEIAPIGTQVRPLGEGDRDDDNLMAETDNAEEAEAGGVALGWTGLVLSILSLFFLPVLTASAGIVIGFFSYRGGARTLGLWAIGIGLLSLLIALFFAPFVVR